MVQPVSMKFWHSNLTRLPSSHMFQGSGHTTGSRGKYLRGFTRLILWLRGQIELQALANKKSLVKVLQSISPTSLIYFSSSSRYVKIYTICLSEDLTSENFFFVHTALLAYILESRKSSITISSLSHLAFSHLSVSIINTIDCTLLSHFWIVYLELWFII